MLVEFNFENYLSFKEHTAFSMVVASTDKSMPENIIFNAQGSGLDLLKTAAIYGPNASGKSNFIKAMSFMYLMVTKAAQEGYLDKDTGVKPFKADSESQKKPSRFEVIFLKDGVRYQYGFSLTSKKIVEEWLYSYPQKKQRVLFERFPTVDDTDHEYKFGYYWKGDRKKISRLTRQNMLFIKVAASFGNETAQNVIDWFVDFKKVSTFPIVSEEMFFSAKTIYDEPQLKESYIDLLKKADLGICDINVLKRPFHESKEFHDLPEMIQKQILAESDESFTYEVKTTHKNVTHNNEIVETTFDLKEESEGTQKFFSISAPLLYGISVPLCLYMDELNDQFHHDLTRFIIKFMNHHQNKSGGQLIFTTHDLNLLDSEDQLFRRDQIWFTEKKPDGSSDLYSLWEFSKPRKKENIRKGYLDGRYGAVPHIEELE